MRVWSTDYMYPIHTLSNLGLLCHVEKYVCA